ncbi:ABC transporter substrate-binding protein [Deltaproteobacteria bacterium TL4]
MRLIMQYVLLFTTILCLLGKPSVLTASGVTERKIIMGSHHPLSGPASRFSEISNSSKAYFQYINDQGGVHGRLIECRYLDDGFQPQRTEKVMYELIFKDPVFLIFNGLGNETHQAVAPWLEQMQIPDLLIGSSHPQWSFPVKPTVFAFNPTPSVEGTVLGRYLSVQHLKEQIVVWYYNEEPFRQAMKSLSQVMIQHNPPVRIHRYTPPSSDIYTDIESIKRYAPQAVVVLAPPELMAPFIKQAFFLGLQAKIYLGYDLSQYEFFKDLEPQMKENLGLLISQPLLSQTDHPGIQMHRAILHAYRQELQATPWTVYGQAVAEVMVEILHRTGRKLTRPRLLESAETLSRWQGMLTPPITFSPQNHVGLTALKIAQVQNGTLQLVSDWISGL